MGLADRYNEILKEEGINSKVKSYAPKKDRTYLVIFLMAIVLLAPSYFLMYQNYNSCSLQSAYLSNAQSPTNSTVINNSFSLKCGTNFIMYAAAIALIVTIILLLVLKVLHFRMRGSS